MTAEDVHTEVEKIRAMRGDDEQAHNAEDGLNQRVLRYIADHEDGRFAAMAAAALETQKIKFSRWCA